MTFKVSENVQISSPKIETNGFVYLVRRQCIRHHRRTFVLQCRCEVQTKNFVKL